ncbi:MAG: hypothetical protein AB7N76_02960 [Planctomycetota bacterium]
MSDALNRIDVASPCEVSWNSMQGDERVRFCGHCNQNVYRLTDMPRAEAMAVLERVEGGEKVCVRFARRADGTVVTNDCPSTVRRGRRRPWAQVGAWAAGLVSAVTAGMTTGCFETDPAPVQPQPTKTAQPTKTTQPAKPQPKQPDPEMMGEMVCPPPKEQPKRPEELGKGMTPEPKPREMMGAAVALPRPKEARSESMGQSVAEPPQRGRPLPRAGSAE